MEVTCPNCESVLECEPVEVASVAPCPACGHDLHLKPETAEGIQEITDFAASQFQQSNKTISAFAREHDLAGADIQLESGLTSELESSHGQKYRVGDEIARGGMGAILDTRDLNLRRRVAMKVMLHPDRVAEAQLARFIEEAQITGQLEHPGIVPVYELGVDHEDRPFYAMKLLRGRTLQDILRKLKDGDAVTVEAWPLSRLVTAFGRVCEAMRYAHAKRVIHRDLKPENIMIGEFGEVQVLDWGLAKILGRPAADGDLQLEAVESVRTDEDSEAFRSMDGTIAGTPNFMAPEQARGEVDKLDERTDVYALGAILYQILCLEYPVAGPSVHSVLAKVRKGQIEPLDQRDTTALRHLPGARIPGAIGAIAMKCLSRKQVDRYADCGALLSDLEAYQNGFATAAEDAGTVRQLALFLKRNKVLALASVLVLGAILAGSAVSLVQRNQAVSALAERDKAEEEKRLAAKTSAPAFYATAHKLAVDGDYSNALVFVQQARANDSEMMQAHLLATYLHVEGQRTNDAVQTATVAHNLDAANLTAHESHRLIQDWAAGDTQALPGIVDQVRQMELLQMANVLQGRHRTQLDVSPEDLERYRAQIRQRLGPKYAGRLSIGKYGLHWYGNDDPTSSCDLSFLKGIPLSSINLSNHSAAGCESDLTALKGMPLAEVRFHGTTYTHDIEPIMGPELRRLELGPIRYWAPENYAAQADAFRQMDWHRHLKGREFVWFQFPDRIPVEDFPHLRVRHVVDRIDNVEARLKQVSGIEVWEEQGNSGLGYAVVSLRPLLALPTLKDVRLEYGARSEATLHVDWTKPTVALQEIEEVLASIRNETELTRWYRHQFELMRYTLRHRLGENPPVPDSPYIQVVGDRAFALVDDYLATPAPLFHMGLDFASVHSEEENRAVQTLAGRRSIAGYEPSLVLGAVQVSNHWQWVDGSSWDFENLAPNIEKQILQVGDRYWEDINWPSLNGGPAKNPSRIRHTARWLLGWPASGPESFPNGEQKIPIYETKGSSLLVWPVGHDPGFHLSEEQAEVVLHNHRPPNGDSLMPYFFRTLPYGHHPNLHAWRGLEFLGEQPVPAFKAIGEFGLPEVWGTEFSAGGNRYLYVPASTTWEKAKGGAERRGGHHACFGTREEMEAVLEYVKEQGWIDMIWVGGSDKAEEGEWRWLDGSPWPEGLWSNTEPNNTRSVEHVAALRPEQDGLNDLPQTEVLPFLVELPPAGDAEDQ